MNHDEWLKSLDLPSGVGVSTSEAFQAGQDCLKAFIKQLWLEIETDEDFINEIRLLADIEE